ncbi:MAG TPA: UrcA family protein [Hyphomonadaceae bacterium]|jgi:UrcA family protein|nr:UrcA family protein [Hyphomonadaceae bacterium]
MSRIVKTLAILVSALALAPVVAVFGAMTATAQQPVQKQLIVEYGDLDLSKEAGVRTLMSRLENASEKVCGHRPMTHAYAQFPGYTACREAAVADAMRRIGVGVTLASSH